MDNITAEFIESITKRLAAIEDKLGGTSETTASIADRLTWIEEQIAIKTDLNKIWNKRFEFIEAHEKDLRKAIEGMGEYLDRQIRKLNEAYYHIFPDRLFQDEKITQQLTSIFTAGLENEPKPDADLV